MHNSQNTVLCQRWESIVLSKDAAARVLQRGAAGRIWELRGKMGDEESSNDAIKDNWEKKILIILQLQVIVSLLQMCGFVAALIFLNSVHLTDLHTFYIFQ